MNVRDSDFRSGSKIAKKQGSRLSYLPFAIALYMGQKDTPFMGHPTDPYMGHLRDPFMGYFREA